MALYHQVKAVLVRLGLRQFEIGGVMDQLDVRLVTRPDLKKQVMIQRAQTD